MFPTRGSTLERVDVLQRGKLKRSRYKSFWKNSSRPRCSVCMCCYFHPRFAQIIAAITLYSTDYHRRSLWMLISNWKTLWQWFCFRLVKDCW